jgi:hypothetical protein
VIGFWAAAGMYLAEISHPGYPAERLIACRMHVQDLGAGDDPARLALRWEETGPGGGLFPLLDADIMLIPAGTHSTTLALTGACRPPPGTAGAELDRVLVYPVAAATIRAFLHRMLHRIAEAIAGPARAAEPGTEAADVDPAGCGQRYCRRPRAGPASQAASLPVLAGPTSRASFHRPGAPPSLNALPSCSWLRCDGSAAAAALAADAPAAMAACRDG